MRWLLPVLILACDSADVPDGGFAEDALVDAGLALDTGIAPFDAGDPEGTHASLSCERDEHCGEGPNLHCDLTIQRGVCTAFCEDSDQALEQIQCDGAGSTCISGLQGGMGICARACEPRASDCPDNMVCTGFWYQRTPLDTPGCQPFCSRGDQCPDGRCNPRLGACGFELDLSLLEDGEPCSLISANECRGGCFSVNTATTGLCASFIDLSRNPQCPDVSERIIPLMVAREDVAICVYRSCADSSECNPRLECKVLNNTGVLACLP